MSVQPVAPVPTPPAVPVVPAVVPAVVPQVEAKPPWGTPEEFDAEKAWARIQHLQDQKNDPIAAKELKDLREFKATSEDANRTEVEKAQARADIAEKALAESVASSLRSAIALEKGLTASQAKRLVGTTREELEADATELLADFPKAVVPKAPNTDGQGNVGGPIEGPKQLSENDLDAMTPQQIEAARTSGQLRELLTSK